MQIVIEIPDEAVKTDNITNDFITYFECCTPKLFETLKNGTPLPEKHGRIIDESQIKECYIPTNYFAIRSIKTDAPTIIEGSESE